MPFLGKTYLLRGVGANLWAVDEPLVYQGQRDLFTVPVGFETDFASVPRLFTWFIPRTGVYSRAAILHDYLCVTAVVTRSDADGLFRRVLREYGISWPRRWMMWAAVRSAWISKAGWKEWLQFLGIAIPSIVFLLVPTVIVVVWSLIFWLFEIWFPRRTPVE